MSVIVDSEGIGMSVYVVVAIMYTMVHDGGK